MAELDHAHDRRSRAGTHAWKRRHLAGQCRLEGFVRAAALEMPRMLRINAVSPPRVKETLVKLGMDPSAGLPSAEVARAYRLRSRARSRAGSSTRDRLTG